jgi:hypothetical protein
MTNRQFSKIKKPIYCPNAQAMGYSKHSASEGDLVRIRTWSGGEKESFFDSFARVLARVNYDGVGKPCPKKPGTLAVLVLSDNAAHAYVRFAGVEDVVEIMDPERYKVFARFFFSSKLPSLEAVDAAAKYGALSADYLDKYLDGEGNLREDWMEANRVTA